MAVSKTTVLAGTLGAGGGAVGTVATVKYVTSKEENSSDQKQETSSTIATVDPLKTIKDQISTWASTNAEGGSCKVRIVFSETETKKLEEIDDSNKKADLESLYTALGGTGTANASAKSNCEKDKFLEAKKGSNNDWTFEKKEN